MVVYIIVGIFISAGVIGGQKYGFTYWNDPGAFTAERSYILNAIVLASLTMQGTEIVGVTAAEADKPSKVSLRVEASIVYSRLTICSRLYLLPSAMCFGVS